MFPHKQLCLCFFFFVFFCCFYLFFFPNLKNLVLVENEALGGNISKFEEKLKESKCNLK